MSYTGLTWATPVFMRNQSILQVICWDLGLAGNNDAILSEELVLNRQHHRTLPFSLKNANYSNDSKTWWEIDTVDVLNSQFLIFLFFLFIYILSSFYSSLVIFVIQEMESNALGMLHKYIITNLYL